MTARKIKAALRNKNVPFDRVEYIRASPTPSGYASGWEVEFGEMISDRLYDAGFDDAERINQLDTLSDVINWIEAMPVLVSLSEIRIIKESSSLPEGVSDDDAVAEIRRHGMLTVAKGMKDTVIVESTAGGSLGVFIVEAQDA